jgi:hypothetical protein
MRVSDHSAEALNYLQQLFAAEKTAAARRNLPPLYMTSIRQQLAQSPPADPPPSEPLPRRVVIRPKKKDA